MTRSLQQIAILILAPMMWVSSSLGFIFPSARSPADMSDANTSLLVPASFAFSIWFPIFVLCISYGVLQALPKNKDKTVFKAVAPWSLAGFAGVCLWGIVNAFAPITPDFDYAQWGTAIVFVPTMLLLVKAMLTATRHKSDVSGFDKVALWGGLSMIAGWCSIAVFLNWTPQVVSGLTALGLDASVANLVMLVIALAWAVFIIRKSGGNRVYAFPIIWGLAFVVLKRATVEPMEPLILGGAAVGIVILIAACVIKPKTSVPILS